MLDKIRGKQVFRAVVGDRSQQLLGMEFGEGMGISGMATKAGRPMIVDDVSRHQSHFKDIDSKVGFQTRSILAVPLMHGKETFGVVEVINPLDQGRFNEEDCQLATVFANLASIAVANSQLREQLCRENQGLKTQLRSSHREMIGESPVMTEVRRLIERVGPSNTTVLILGDTGTGKELAARQVHATSPRAGKPFIAVNCAALPHTLLESELFGYEAGAFTGANARKLGRFELADGGTIFLDEVAEIAPDVQVKLLRVLQEREIVRVGGVNSIPCDVRVIAATNRNLKEEIQAGRFREDLFYRLNVFPIHLPPLRERKGDVPMLVHALLKSLSGEMKMPTPGISAEAMAMLMSYEFPGNIRELQNVLERACLLCGCDGAEIGVGHLPKEITQQQGSAEENSSALEAGEKAMVLNALRANDWNQTKAAEELGISRDNIRYRIKKYDIKRPG
jgi:Nif-specific regulatory protein